MYDLFDFEKGRKMNFQDKVVVITGGAHGIGLCAADEFKKYSVHVCVIDCSEGDHYVGNIGNKVELKNFAQAVIEKYGCSY